MTDPTREELANAILDALEASVYDNDDAALFINRYSLTWTCIDGHVDLLATVDALLDAYRVVPRRDAARARVAELEARDE